MNDILKVAWDECIREIWKKILKPDVIELNENEVIVHDNDPRVCNQNR